MLSPELLKELKIILEEDFGLKLDDSEVEEYYRAFLAYGEWMAKAAFDEMKEKGEQI